MNTLTAALDRRRATRAALAVAAISALALSLMYLARPVAAVSTVNIYIGSQFIGASSATFDSQDSDCGGYTTGVVWHFILNNFDANTPAGTLTAQFASAADQTVSESKLLNNVQHYYVNTPTDDTLENAWATIDTMSGQTDAKLVLSHVCHTGTSASESASESSSASESASASSSASESASESSSASESASESSSASESASASSSASQSQEGGVEAATGTPAASVPNTALGSNPGSPTGPILFALLLLGSLATLAVMNVRSARVRR